MFVLQRANLNLEQVFEAAGWRQTGKHVGISLKGLSERPGQARGLMHPPCFI